MRYFSEVLSRLPEYRRVLSAFLREGKTLPVMATGLSHVHKAAVMSALVSGQPEGRVVLALAESESAALRLCDDINTFAGEAVAALYPARDLHMGSVEAVSREYEHERLATLTHLQAGRIKLVLATAEAAAQITIPPDVLAEKSRVAAFGQSVDLNELIACLVSLGYSRTDMLEGTAQFAVRGSIVDISPPGAALPVRIELFDNEIDSVSVFDMETQRRIDTIKRVVVTPAREFLFDNAELADKLQALQKHLRTKTHAEMRDAVAEDIERLEGGAAPKNADKYAPLCYKKLSTLFDYCDAVIVNEHVAVAESYRAVTAQFEEDLVLLTENGEMCRGLEKQMLSPAELRSAIDTHVRAYLETFTRGGDLRLSDLVSFNCSQLSSWSGEYRLLVSELNDYFSKGYSVAVFAGTEKYAKQLAQDLKDDGLPVDFSGGSGKIFAKRAYVLAGAASSGYDFPEAHCALISLMSSPSQKLGGEAAFNRAGTSAPAKKKRKTGEEIRSLTDISLGDYVVHDNHGVGRFEGVTKLTSGGVSKDYIKIAYAGTDVLYIPVTQLDLISRYIGNTDPGVLKLNKLHSDTWQKSKAKARAAAAELAQELVELYKKRMRSVGYKFAPDTEEQRDFENRFDYVETDDQLRCVADIKRDMMTARPMDRLLCGDVGFGKTEVALRAAFKCVMEGKQCALLCPTTVLAWQHFQTASKRCDGLPVNISLLSRFCSPREVRETLMGLREGIVDFVIGTHRLVQKDIEFFDLGLVIIDEEQRFGVSHKDKFKEMFSGVDILTLSATPIPRTLNMAMSGLRDMSVIETPPQDRQPVTTYVIEHDAGVIAQAIIKELRRSGQVYYIHNRIETILDCAAKIQALVPEAKIGIAHGRMGEDELLETWRKLLDREIDVLVCTTLIETGVDVPNVNTLVIENADHMGLAQLHQLRGRVGRTNRRAFAYFTFKRGKTLSEIADKRLSAIREFTHFGAGFRVAMRDLEIRGAGSVLGERQSGHLSAVGYDMYLKLLAEAVAEADGSARASNAPGTSSQPNECLIDIKMDAFIPESYISNQAQRIICYKRIAAIKTEDDAYDVTDELLDRYGDPPPTVEGLISVAKLRGAAQRAGLIDIIQNGDELVFHLPENKKPDMRMIAEAVDILGDRLKIDNVGKPAIKVKITKGETPIDVMQAVLGSR